MRLLGLLDRIWGVRIVATLIRDHVGLVDDLFYCESGKRVGGCVLACPGC